MSLFRFALQPLLEARSREEDECRAALAAAAHDAAVARARVFAARADLARAGAVFRAFGPSVSAAAVREASARMLLLGDALAYARANALRSSERETLARTAYTTARFERRRVELLRDRALAAFARAAERAETLQIDEGNAARHNSTALEEHIEAFVHHGSRTFGPSEPLADLAALSGQLNPTESEPVR